MVVVDANCVDMWDSLMCCAKFISMIRLSKKEVGNRSSITFSSSFLLHFLVTYSDASGAFPSL